MGVFSRFADIVNSNINSLLEKAEDPEKMVRLIIQEMEDTLVEVRSSSARTLAQKKDLERRLLRLQENATEWEHKAELALSKEREDLARLALQEKQRVNDSIEVLQQELDAVDENLNKLKSELEQLQDKLKDARSRQKALALRSQTASNRLQIKQQLDNHKVHDALQRFDAYERKIDDLEAQVDSYDLTKQGKSLEQEFADLESESQVDAELAALKKKLSKDAE